MNRIKQLREELKISQNELAKKLNKTQQMISLYENGTYELDLDGYIILSNIFNCSIEYIAGKSDIRNPKIVFPTNSTGMTNILYRVLENANLVKPGEDLSDEQFEYLKKLIDANAPFIRNIGKEEKEKK